MPPNNQPPLPNTQSYYTQDGGTNIYDAATGNYTYTPGNPGLYSAGNALSKSYNDSVATAGASYDPLISAQYRANKAYEAGVNTEGVVSGRGRYSPLVQGGIMHGAISEGLSKIGQLVNQKNAAIQAAILARDENNYKMMKEASDRAAAAEKAIRDAAQQTFENGLKSKADARAQAEADQKALDNTAGSVAYTISTINDPNKKQAYIDNFAKTHGFDPVRLTSSVLEFNDKKYKEVDQKMYTIAAEFPGIVTSEDIANHNITSLLLKIPNSEAYKLANAAKRAALAKALAEATTPNTVDDAIASQWATMGKPPTGLKPGSLAYSTAYEYAKKWAKDNLAQGTIVDQATGFQLPAGKVPAATLQKVGATVATFSIADEMRNFLESHTTYPGGKVVAGLGKLAKLTPADTEYFMRLRDGLTAQYVQSISGVAVNEAEYKRLSNLIPNTGDWNKYNLAKMDAFLDNMKANTKSNLGISNATIKGVDLQTSFDKKAEIAKFKSSNPGKIIIQDKDGNILPIDSDADLQPGDVKL